MFNEYITGNKCFIRGENITELCIEINHCPDDIDDFDISIDKNIYDKRNNCIYMGGDNCYSERTFEYDDNGNIVHEVHFSKDDGTLMSEHRAIYDDNNRMIFRKSYYNDDDIDYYGNYIETYFHYDRNNGYIFKKDLSIYINEDECDKYLSLNNRLEDFESHITISIYENIYTKIIEIDPDEDIRETWFHCYKDSIKSTIIFESDEILLIEDFGDDYELEYHYDRFGYIGSSIHKKPCDSPESISEGRIYDTMRKFFKGIKC